MLEWIRHFPEATGNVKKKAYPQKLGSFVDVDGKRQVDVLDSLKLPLWTLLFSIAGGFTRKSNKRGRWKKKKEKKSLVIPPRVTSNCTDGISWRNGSLLFDTQNPLRAVIIIMIIYSEMYIYLPQLSFPLLCASLCFLFLVQIVFRLSADLRKTRETVFPLFFSTESEHTKRNQKKTFLGRLSRGGGLLFFQKKISFLPSLRSPFI